MTDKTRLLQKSEFLNEQLTEWSRAFPAMTARDARRRLDFVTAELESVQKAFGVACKELERLRAKLREPRA